MSDMALEIARMVDMLPEDEQRLAYEVIKRFVIAWDPDFTKLTPEEARRLEEAELSVYDKIKTGLEEAIAFERGELSSHTSEMTIQPVDVFEADDIQNIP